MNTMTDTSKCPPGTDAWRVSGWMHIDGKVVDTHGWIVAEHHVAGYGLDSDQISRALGSGRTRKAAIAAAWANLLSRSQRDQDNS